jgi:hypothetical protein
MEGQGQNDMVNVLKVEADSLDQLIIKDEAVIVEVINASKAGLILDNSSTTSLANTALISWTVAHVGDGVKKYKVGDQIFDLNERMASFFELGERKFILTDEYSIKIGVRK